MKVLENIALTIFSVVILIFSLLFCLILFNWIEESYVYLVLQYIKAEPIATNIALGTSVVLMLLAVKCIFFPAYTKEKEEKLEGGGILLENESGKLMISIETIENIVKSVINEFSNVRSVNCKVKLDRQINNVIIDINLVVAPETIIKDLSANLQNKIKEVIKTTTEIEVKQVNVKIKNIETQKNNA